MNIVHVMAVRDQSRYALNDMSARNDEESAKIALLRAMSCIDNALENKFSVALDSAIHYIEGNFEQGVGPSPVSRLSFWKDLAELQKALQGA